MSNLGLPPRSSVRNKRQQQNRRPAAPRTPSRDMPNNNNSNNNAGTRDHEWCVIERRNRHRHSIGKCANCSETNHVTANCKHHQKVQFRQCGERGHKEKHHTRNYANGLNSSTNQATNNNSLYRSTIRPCAPDLIVNKRSGWDLPTILNLNARSLSEEKLDELQGNVTIHDVSIIRGTETWFKHYMDDNNLSIEGFSVERKDRCYGRTGGGVACYIRNSFMYEGLSNLEEKELGVIWLKIMPKQISRKLSYILIACIYFTQMTEYAKMREHLITCVDGVIRKHPECGVIITGD